MSQVNQSRGKQPWQKRRWASGRIRDKSSTFIFFSIFIALIFTALAGLALYGVWHDHSQGAALFVFPIILALLAGLTIAWATRQVMVRLKFGRSIFEMEIIPGAIGGWLAGTIIAPRAFEASKSLRLELECVERKSGRDFEGNKMSIRDTVLSRGKQTLGAPLPRNGEGKDAGMRIPVAFEIPRDAKPTYSDFQQEILWRLHARAGQRGADYDATFIVPVYVVPDASKAIPQAEAVAAPLRTSQSSVSPVE